MSAAVTDATPGSINKNDNKEPIVRAPKGGNYRGFVAGVFSGIAKLSVGYVNKQTAFSTARSPRLIAYPIV